MIGPTTLLEKSVIAGANITAFTIGKFGVNDDTMIPGAAVGDLLTGIFQHDALSGTEVRITLLGISKLKLGGAVTRGDKLTTNATGQGVTAAPATGINNQIIGIAASNGVSGDIIPCILTQSVMQGA